MVEHLLVDTGVLISAVDIARSNHDVCRHLIERHPALSLCAQSCREFLAVSIRPVAANGLGMSCEHACANLETLRGRIVTLPEEKPLLSVLLDVIRSHQLVGRSIHDAGIVAAVIAHQLGGLVTTDAQIFSRYPGMRVITPQDALLPRS